MTSASRRPARSVLPLVAVALLLVSFGRVQAQYFGRNKVQWEKFDFKVLKTRLFDIYYYPEEDRPVADAARMAERWYERLQPVFGFRFDERKPIVLYANQADFQQTTVTGGLIGEGTGGFTEPLKSRLVMPLAGAYAETDHVLGHELVHEFQFDIARSLPGGGEGAGLGQVPLWMIEGLAEYLSVGREDPLTAMWVRDAVRHDALPRYKDLNSDPRYFPYRWGQAFWAYIGGRYGERAVTSLFVGSLRGGAPAAFVRVLGATPEDVFAQWQRQIRLDYGPVLRALPPLREAGRRVLGRGGRDDDMNLAPALSPDGTKVAFLSTRDLFTIDLYLADARTGKVERKLVSSEGDPHFEALRFIDSSGSWSPDGRKLAFVVYARGDNQIAIVDVRSRRIEKRLELPGVGSASNPVWSPDGRRIAFSGSAHGETDLYVIGADGSGLEALTDDPYADLQPAWSPDGTLLAFTTDRGPGTDLATLTYGPMRLAILEVAGGRIRVLPIFADAKQINPQFSPDGRDLFFIADPDGISNVYRYDREDGTVWRVTNVPTGVTGITALAPALAVAQDQGGLMFSVFDDTRYDIYALDADEAAGTRVAPPGDQDRTAAVLPPVAPSAADAGFTALARQETPAPPVRTLGVEDYRPRLSLDAVGQPYIGVGTDRYGFGLAGGISAYFSDILGEHQLGVAFQGGGSSSDFGGNVGAQATYLNRQHRLNWGGSVQRIPYLSASTFVGAVIGPGGLPTGETLIQQVREEVVVSQVGLVTLYPFDISHRVELLGTRSRLDFRREVDQLLVSGDIIVDEDTRRLDSFGLDLTEAAVAYVGDTSFFGFTSPLRGTRYRFEAGSTFGSLNFTTGLADWRGYVFRRPIGLAFRALSFGRYGGDSEDPRLSPLFVGRETLVRGYAIGSFDLSECTPVENGSSCPEFDRLEGSRLAVANFEVRVPVLGSERLGLREAPYLPLELAAFVDAGAAWREGSSPKWRFDRDTTDRVPVVSAGVAARLLLGGFVPLEFYWAKPFQRPEEGMVFGFLITPGW